MNKVIFLHKYISKEIKLLKFKFKYYNMYGKVGS